MQRVHRIPSPFQRQIEGIPSAILTRAHMPFEIYSAAPSASGSADLGLYTYPYTPALPADLISNSVYGYDYLFGGEEEELEEQTMNERRISGILNAFQYRLMRSSGANRAEHWRSQPASGIVSETMKELGARIGGWQWYGEQMVIFDDPDLIVTHEIALDWGARIICTLAFELEMLQKGLDVYRSALDNELLPWQCMNRNISLNS